MHVASMTCHPQIISLTLELILETLLTNLPVFLNSKEYVFNHGRLQGNFCGKNWPSTGIKIIILTAVLWEIIFFSSLSSSFQTNLIATVPKNACLYPLKTDVTQNHVREKIIVS